jgi:hypothetical protein
MRGNSSKRELQLRRLFPRTTNNKNGREIRRDTSVVAVGLALWIGLSCAGLAKASDGVTVTGN